MRLKWYGTATILLESGETRLLFDPYQKSFAAGAGVPLDEARTANAILITHPHLDHFSDIDLFSQGRCPVYVSAKGIALARENGLQTECMHAIGEGDVLTVGPFRIRAYPARHCRFDAATVLRVLLAPRTWLHFSKAVALLRGAGRYRIRRDEVLAFEVTDGERTLLLFGSAAMDEGAAYPVGADLLVFPYQGRARMDRVLRPFLQKLRPQAILIDHFDDAFPPITCRVNTARLSSTVRECLPQAQAIIPDENVWYPV